MRSISPEVQHLLDFDPFCGKSYKDYGNYTDESASKGYLTLMKQCAMKLSKDAQRTPSLRRIAHFVSKIVETKTIDFQPIARATRVFCLGDFVAKKKEPVVVMDIDPPTPTNEYSAVVDVVTDEPLTAETKINIIETPESDSDAIMKETSLTANDQ
jgi:hypothetical protein